MRKVVYYACAVALGINAAMLFFNIVTSGGFVLIGLNTGSIVLCWVGMEANK